MTIKALEELKVKGRHGVEGFGGPRNNLSSNGCRMARGGRARRVARGGSGRRAVAELKWREEVAVQEKPKVVRVTVEGL